MHMVNIMIPFFQNNSIPWVGAVRPLAANAPSPVYLYAVETALQLAVTELSENLGTLV